MPKSPYTRQGGVPAHVEASRAIAKLRPKGRDPEAELARRLAGRRYSDAETRDGYISLAYARRFRPYPAADGRRRRGEDDLAAA